MDLQLAGKRALVTGASSGIGRGIAEVLAREGGPCASPRYGRPADVGMVVAMIASPQSAFINGANYRVDGGQLQAVN